MINRIKTNRDFNLKKLAKMNNPKYDNLGLMIDAIKTNQNLKLEQITQSADLTDFLNQKIEVTAQQQNKAIENFKRSRNLK